jgi:hypothetical protein
MHSVDPGTNRHRCEDSDAFVHWCNRSILRSVEADRPRNFEPIEDRFALDGPNLAFPQPTRHDRAVNIAPFWARAEHDGVAGLGWSFHDGKRCAGKRARRARENALRLGSGGWENGGTTYYSIRPLQEPIIRQFANQSAM